MSHKNKHQHNSINSISLNYMHNELGPWIKCPKRSCPGTMTDIFVRWIQNGPIFNDKECTTCGKVTKDPRTFAFFKDINQKNRDMRKQKGKGRRKKIYTNRIKLDKLEVLTNARLQGALQHDSTRREPRGR